MLIQYAPERKEAAKARRDSDGIRYLALGNDWNGHDSGHGCVTTSNRSSFMVFMQQPLGFEAAGRLCDATPSDPQYSYSSLVCQ